MDDYLADVELLSIMEWVNTGPDINTFQIIDWHAHYNLFSLVGSLLIVHLIHP